MSYERFEAMSAFKSPTAYHSDLADIHDRGFGDFARTAAPALLEMLRRHGINDGLVVDLGCGSGLWAQALTAAGYEVLGIDISAAMIKRARQRAPQAKFKRASFFAIALPSCAAVTSLGECLNYRFDGRHHPAALARLFGRVHASLPRGGVFIFDFLEPGQWRNRKPAQRWASGRDWATLVRAEEDTAQRVLTRHITSFRRIGRFYRRREEIHRQRLYSPSEIAAMLRQAGFSVRWSRGYGEMRFLPGHCGCLARKR